MRGGHLASYVLGGYNPRTKIAHFTAIMTRPEYRKTGLAAKLFKKLFESALKFSPKEFKGVVSPDNEASLALFHKFGFSQHVVEENYYGGGEKRVVLRATKEAIKLSAK